jgi:hypothetical protein
MTFRGTVQNGVVVLLDGVDLPDGTTVEVTPLVNDKPQSHTAATDPIFQLAQLAVDTGIPDLATNIDHYLYGDYCTMASSSTSKISAANGGIGPPSGPLGP